MLVVGMYRRHLGIGLVAAALSLGSVAVAQGDNASQARQHAVRADAALKAGHPDQAIPEFEALLRIDPTNVDAQANLGVLLYFKQRFDLAEEHFRSALAGEPSLSKIRGLLGLSERALGQRDAAIDDLQQALPQLDEPKFAKQVGLALLELQSAKQDLAGAVATAQQLRSKAPEDPEILYASYRTATDLAGDSLLSLSLAAPNSGQMQMAIAHELLRVRDLPGAIASFRRAIVANPALPGVHFELAEALYASPNTADHPLAEQEYRKAVAANPQDLQAKVRLADVLVERSAMDEAAGLYQQALKANPHNVDAAVGLAHIDSERGDDAAALPLLEQAIADDPSNMLARFRLSTVDRKLKRLEDAKRELAEYQKLKALKDKLRGTYSTMKLAAPGTSDAETPESGGMSH
ncbi:Lipopolysaccharide biosynthesis regulator YciM, contains six TPR domains and a predicted metal-binding C-terminal domain [Bryocella elongata]|uniref:Lipopolysaccharide biosynthesis regulator YciM, contains six TPR domains and a predicted metal-binding C-terminal domain n=1 Tax=Bryocella elongata TaxID=863522 RepID=A0A1H5WNL7_9BACT|nr:tetratricopeptide repeat protein [Bryocella elongata]SEG00597.1 Lipopolysaccharide biosynthesis regulator YciM, contains six TPR domains and a predicted metal-binding C-terminal domain [Bryocella elongata]